MSFALGSICSSSWRPGIVSAIRTGFFRAEELTHGIHAGDIETSLMLSFRPELVRMEAAEDFASEGAALESDFTWLRAGRPTGFGWMTQDLSEAGAMGNAAAASAEKGEASADYGVTAFIELLQDIEAFDLARLRAAPKERSVSPAILATVRAFRR